MSEAKILVLYYSRNGNTQKMADFIAEGIESVDSARAVIRTVAPISATHEKLDDAIPKVGAPYVNLQDLDDIDGIALGSPTRFGNMAAPMKYFWDTTAGHWMKGTLINKPATVFTSTASLHGGQETTLLSMMLPLLHHGCVIVGVPFSEPELSNTRSGGTPYGTSHLAGNDASIAITAEEKKLCIAQGKRLAELTKAIKHGKN